MAGSKTLVSLVLDNNDVGDTGVQALCEHMVSSVQGLRQLSLKGNNITAHGASELLKCYEQGTTLYQVELQGNNVGCEMVDAFIIGNKTQVGRSGCRHRNAALFVSPSP